MRSFVALRLPESCQAALIALAKELRAEGLRASWVRPEQHHLTLRFLGDAPDQRLDALRARLADLSRRHAPIAASLGGLGAFGGRGRRRLALWAAFLPGDGALDALQRDIETAAAEAGFPPETRPFHPHLTLGRVRRTPDQARAREAAARRADFTGPGFTCHTMVLMASALTPDGPIHRPIQEYSLDAAGDRA